MMQPLQIAVIADDLTGAADTGVQFCQAVGPVHLTSLPVREVNLAGIRTGGLAISTDSRHADAVTAGEDVRLVWAKLRPLAPLQIYKKIDSSLRGNLGAEIDALHHETAATATFIAPAFPEQGRITENDIHMVNGVPVAETELSHDPRCPVQESRLSVLLSGQSRMSVGHVEIGRVDQGISALAVRVRELLDWGNRLIVFDAVNNRHLDAIVSLAAKDFRDKKIILAGSAGLAESLARHMARKTEPAPVADRPRIADWLFVCGSTSSILAEQVADLIHHTNLQHIILDPSFLAAGDAENGRHLAGSMPKLERSAPGTVLSIAPRDSSASHRESPQLIIGGMARVVAGLMEAKCPQGLFLSGGDTAGAALSAIGATGIRLVEQILPGLVRGEVIGGAFNGLPVVTKAGAFGTVDTLAKLINSFK